MRLLLAAALALTTLMGLPTVTPPPAARAAAVCTGWNSTRVPPSTIRVLRSSGTSKGYVQAVDFKTYVQIVLAAEWPPSWPTAALQTGAIAVKQYGWYYTMHWRGGTAHSSCYDVADNTSDQIYQPESRTPSAGQLAAIEATWTTSVTKNGAFLMMGYRSGVYPSACGADADGYHLYQHSSLTCANNGMTFDQILHVYFDPGIALWAPPAMPSAIFLSPPNQEQVTVGTSATVVWAEQPAAGTTISSRLVSLLMALPFNGSCAVDRWVPASPAWQSTAASPQTVTGLHSGYCYRAVVALTDSTTATTEWQSGTMLVDPAAPTGTFTTPIPGVVTALSGTTATIRDAPDQPQPRHRASGPGRCRHLRRSTVGHGDVRQLPLACLLGWAGQAVLLPLPAGSDRQRRSQEHDGLRRPDGPGRLTPDPTHRRPLPTHGRRAGRPQRVLHSTRIRSGRRIDRA
jgi:hypothetical protein